MLINIDIQIENDNGKPLHRFLKQFDCKETGIVPYENQSFEYFLAQVLSYSGKTVRSILLDAEEPSVNRQEEPELQIQEVEYTVRLNSGDTFGGTIPFYPSARDGELEPGYEQSAKTVSRSTKEGGFRRSELPFPVKKRQMNIRSAVKIIMEHAVIQYEAQFLQMSNQEIHFMKNS